MTKVKSDRFALTFHFEKICGKGKKGGLSAFSVLSRIFTTAVFFKVAEKIDDVLIMKVTKISIRMTYIVQFQCLKLLNFTKKNE